MSEFMRRTLLHRPENRNRFSVDAMQQSVSSVPYLCLERRTARRGLGAEL